MSTLSCVSLLLLIAILYMDTCYSVTIPINFDTRMTGDMVISPKKRQFCNVFSGCGGKRSEENSQSPVQEMKQRQFVDEKAIYEMFRQILSKAKLWEAVLEASAEIARREQKEAYNN